MSWFRRKRRTQAADLEAYFTELANAVAVEPYTPEDRYRDFRHVFMASETGRRVLREILAWAHMAKTSMVRGDAFATHFAEGERNIGIRLLVTATVEPRRLPMQATSEKPKGEP
jgi:hypothetical protein